MSKNIEILSEYIEPDETCCLERCKGNVISVPKAEGKNQNKVHVIRNEKISKGETIILQM